MENSSIAEEESLQERIRTEKRGLDLLPLAEGEITRLCNIVGLSDGIKTVSKAIYRRALEHSVIQNRSVAEVSAAAVFAACRVEAEARVLSEVAEESIVSERDISRTHAELSRELGLNTGPTDPKDFVPRYCDEFDLSDHTESKACEMIDAAEESGVVNGRSPAGIAAGAVYVSTLLNNERITQQQIGDVASVSASTIRTRYQEILYAYSDDYEVEDLYE